MIRQRLPSAGSLERLSRPSSVLRTATTPHRSSRFALVFPLLGGTAARGFRGGLPGSWGTLRAFAMLSDPGPTSSPSLGDDLRFGESLFPAAFACDSSPLPVPQSVLDRLSRRPAALRCCPRSIEPRRLLTTSFCFRGSITWPQHSLSTLRSSRHRDTTQDSLPAGGQPLPRGPLPAHRVPREVSASSTSLPPHPGFAWRNPCSKRPVQRRMASG